MPVSIRGQADSKGQFLREYTNEHPLVYEDAWDLWPYVFLDNGKPTGYNVDLLEMIFKELDIPFVIRLKQTPQALDDLRNGKSDLMLGMMAPFHDDYSRHYGKSIIHIFTHSVAYPSSMQQTVRNFNDLETHQVIVHDGSFSHHMMEDWGWGNNAIPYFDMDRAIQQVSAEGRGQVLWNTMSLKWLIHKYHADNLTLSPVDMPSGEYRFMTADTVLLRMLDETFARLKASERLQPLEMKWFYPEDEEHHTLPAWLWLVAAAIGAIALIMAITSIIYHIRERHVTYDGRLRIARLALVLKISKIRIFTYDIKHKTITFYDENAHPKEKYTVDEFAKRYSKDEFEMMRNAINELRTQEKTISTMHRETDDDDRHHVFTTTFSVLNTEKGQPSIIIATRRENTEEYERQRTNDELMQRYKAVFNTAMVDMVYYDSQCYLANMNERACETFGMTLEEARSKRINIMNSFDKKNIQTYVHMTQFLTPRGEIQDHSKASVSNSMCYEMQMVPVFNDNHEMLGIYATGHDVTEVAHTYRKARNGVIQLKEAMKELGEYVNNINYVLQIGGVRMVNYSPQTHTLTINHRMHEAQYVLTQQRCLSFTDPVSVNLVMRLFRAMDNRKSMPIIGDIRTTLRIKGEKRVCLLAQLFPTFDANGNITAYTGLLRDTTEIKHTELMLMKETEKAQEVEQLKQKFLHNMCYEIRTPLNTVVSNAEMFEKEHDAADEQTFIESIKKNSAYLLNLINDILFLSRLDAHMVEIAPSPCDFSQTIGGHCNNGWSNNRKEGVEYIVESQYEHLVLNIDDTNIGRIIEQLVRNSVYHTTHGRVRVRYEHIAGKLIIGVDDTGEGIAPNVLEHIFERFNTTSEKTNSTGLGLPICKELVTQMGGTIDITSQVGKGTTVWISIPCEAISLERKRVKGDLKDDK